MCWPQYDAKSEHQDNQWLCDRGPSSNTTRASAKKNTTRKCTETPQPAHNPQCTWLCRSKPKICADLPFGLLSHLTTAFHFLRCWRVPRKLAANHKPDSYLSAFAEQNKRCPRTYRYCLVDFGVCRKMLVVTVTSSEITIVVTENIWFCILLTADSWNIIISLLVNHRLCLFVNAKWVPFCPMKADSKIWMCYFLMNEMGQQMIICINQYRIKAIYWNRIKPNN